MRPMHIIDSPAAVNPVIYNNSHQFAEPLADDYLFKMSDDQLRDLARTVGTSPDYFVRRAHCARIERHHRNNGNLRESEK